MRTFTTQRDLCGLHVPIMETVCETPGILKSMQVQTSFYPPNPFASVVSKAKSQEAGCLRFPRVLWESAPGSPR